MDHTPGAANGVMGVDIGGCETVGFDPEWDCAWTAYVDTSFFDRDILFSFWRHLHAPGWRDGAGEARGVRHRVMYRLRGSGGETTLEMMDGGFGYNDDRWEPQSYVVRLLPGAEGAQEVAFGICYQRSTRVRNFAGWSVDDVLVRQQGCMESR